MATLPMSVTVSMVTMLLLTLSARPVQGFPDYQTTIPNGDRVPHPCVSGQAWLGVGHTNPAGGGSRNPFGHDFDRNGKKWTPKLCRMDSDGDGRTNGEELGDPGCTWREELPHRHAHAHGLANITHPGICDPVTSPKCRERNSWLKCMPGSSECEAFKDKDLRNLTIRLPSTPVPAEETTYSCMLFRVPDENSFHLVAAQPLLNNTRVVHHMLLFGCRGLDADTVQSVRQPYRCEMVPHPKCQEVILTWTIGIQLDCIHKDAGFRLGKNGYRVVALQVHWNNPEKASDFTDSSGLLIHFTSNLRRHDAGILVTGHVYLQLDPLRPGSDNKTTPLQIFTSTCPQHCMREMFNTTIYITTTINHMHNHGYTQRTELIRAGSKVEDLAWDPYFSYHSPVAHRLDPPVPLHPGDEIRTTCTFRRPRSGSQPVCYGEATSDEMCFGFITYFPLQPALEQPWCTSRRGLISCERTLPALWDRPIAGCSWRNFTRPPSKRAQAMVGRVLTTCYNYGTTPPSGNGTASRPLVCSQSCRDVLGEVRQHPCFVGDIGYYVLSKLRLLGQENGEMFVRAWFTCNCDLDYDYCERKRPLGSEGVLAADKELMCSRAGGLTGGSAATAVLVASPLVLALIFTGFSLTLNTVLFDGALLTVQS